MPSRPLTKTAKRLFLGTGFLIALALGIPVFFQSINRDPDWKFPAPQPTPSPNRYDLYTQAAAAITPPKIPVDPVWSEDAVTPAQAAARYSLPRQEQWLNANARGFELIKQAQLAPLVRPDNQSGAAKFQHTLRYQKLVRSLITRANTYYLNRQYILAFYSGLDAYQAALDTAVGGQNFDLSEAFRQQRWVLKCLEKNLPHLTTLQAAALARRVERMAASSTTLAQTLEVDKWQSLRQLKRVMDAGTWRQVTIRDGPEKKVPLYLKPKRAVFDEIVAWNDYYIRLAASPYKATLPAPGAQPSLDWLVPNKTFPSLQTAYLTNRAQLRLFILRLHLQAFFLEKGRYPSSFGEFKDLRPSVLTDPFSPTQQPVHYRRQGDGYLLWSVGPDAVNNNGKPISKIVIGLQHANPDALGDLVKASPVVN